jgi:hypothetical protein
MAIDLKYGKVQLERGDIGDDEPVVVFRARDKLLPKVLSYYLLFCMKEGSPRKHIDLILKAVDIVKDWQSKNKTKVPSSDGYKD